MQLNYEKSIQQAQQQRYIIIKVSSEIDVGGLTTKQFGVLLLQKSIRKHPLSLFITETTNVPVGTIHVHNEVRHFVPIGEGQTISIAVINGKDTVRIHITNPGKPIPEEEVELIWERYHRVQHQGGRKEGTGIGLSIVSTILEAHGFAYGVESSEDSNTFWFNVPC